MPPSCLTPAQVRKNVYPGRSTTMCFAMLHRCRFWMARNVSQGDRLWSFSRCAFRNEGLLSMARGMALKQGADTWNISEWQGTPRKGHWSIAWRVIRPVQNRNPFWQRKATVCWGCPKRRHFLYGILRGLSPYGIPFGFKESLAGFES